MALAACSSAGNSGNSAKSGTTGKASGSAKSALYSASIQALLPKDVLSKGYIVDGVSNASPPTSYVTADGKYAGYESEMSKLFSEVMGITIKTPPPITFDGIVPGIAAGRFDFGNMNDTLVRQKTMDFVDLLYAGGGLLTKSGNPLKLSDATLCGHTVSGQKGSVYSISTLPDLSKACTAAGKKPINVTVFPDLNAAILALHAGRTDAIMDDTQFVAYVAKQNQGLEFVGTSQKNGLWGYGFKKGSALVPAFKAAAQKLLDDGELDKIINKYQIQTLRLPKITVNGTTTAG